MSLRERYTKEVVEKMKEQFGYKNEREVPRLVKVVVNTSFGRLVAGKGSDETKKATASILDNMASITGQKPSLKVARKSIAGFKIREGAKVGASVTLRGKRMYDFLERLIHITLPRSRDFWGISEKSFDENGNLTIGIKEHVIFPELPPEKVKTIFGLEVTAVTTARTREEGQALFRLLGFPIQKK